MRELTRDHGTRNRGLAEVVRAGPGEVQMSGDPLLGLNDPIELTDEEVDELVGELHKRFRKMKDGDVDEVLPNDESD